MTPEQANQKNSESDLDQEETTESNDEQTNTDDTETEDEEIFKFTRSELDRLKGEISFKSKENAEKKLKSDMNLKYEAEKLEGLKNSENYQELYETIQTKYDSLQSDIQQTQYQSEVQVKINDNNLGVYSKLLLKLPTMEDVDEAILTLNSSIDDLALDVVDERLKTTRTIPSKKKATLGSKKSIDMNREEYAEHRKTIGTFR